MKDNTWVKMAECIVGRDTEDRLSKLLTKANPYKVTPFLSHWMDFYI